VFTSFNLIIQAYKRQRLLTGGLFSRTNGDFGLFLVNHNDLVIGTSSAGLSVALALFNAATVSAMQWADRHGPLAEPSHRCCHVIAPSRFLRGSCF
jgi:hypothetical protein